MRTTLPEPIYADIRKLCAEGDEFAETNQFDEAIDCYRRALAMLPGDPALWEASTWIYAAIGDAEFLKGDSAAALESFRLAQQAPGGSGNPFVHLRRGQALVDLGRVVEGTLELQTAHRLAGDEIFDDEDPRYLTLVTSQDG